MTPTCGRNRAILSADRTVTIETDLRPTARKTGERGMPAVYERCDCKSGLTSDRRLDSPRDLL